MTGDMPFVISPPSGNMENYINSLDLLLHRDDIYYWPSHGPGIRDTKNHVESFVVHRKKREQQILDELAKGANTIFPAPGCPALHAGVCHLLDKKRHHRL